MHGDHDGIIPGNALVVDPKKQFRPLSKFGNAFLNRFQCSQTKSEVLKGAWAVAAFHLQGDQGGFALRFVDFDLVCSSECSVLAWTAENWANMAWQMAKLPELPN